MGARRFGFSENGAIIQLLAGSRLHTMRGPSNLIKSTACYRCLANKANRITLNPHDRFNVQTKLPSIERPPSQLHLSNSLHTASVITIQQDKIYWIFVCQKHLKQLSANNYEACALSSGSSETNRFKRC